MATAQTTTKERTSRMRQMVFYSINSRELSVREITAREKLGNQQCI
jgi:hypothetical protein